MNTCVWALGIGKGHFHYFLILFRPNNSLIIMKIITSCSPTENKRS